MNMKTNTVLTNIRISKELQQIIKEHKNKGETYDNCVRRLIGGVMTRDGIVYSQEDQAFVVTNSYYDDENAEYVEERTKTITYSTLKKAKVGKIFKPERLKYKNKVEEKLEVISKTDDSCYCILKTYQNDVLVNNEGIAFTWV